jgi:hypothetical protein
LKTLSGSIFVPRSSPDPFRDAADLGRIDRQKTPSKRCRQILLPATVPAQDAVAFSSAMSSSSQRRPRAFDVTGLLRGGLVALAAMGPLYSISDVAEDLYLERILSRQEPVTPGEASFALALTRAKFATIVFSIQGGVVFEVLSSFFRRRTPRRRTRRSFMFACTPLRTREQRKAGGVTGPEPHRRIASPSYIWDLETPASTYSRIFGCHRFRA